MARGRKKIFENTCVNKMRIYRTWSAMKGRCYNSNRPNYKGYGGRGITVCEEWKNNFMAFYTWAMASGYQEHLTIERINNDGNYEPSNCTWITMGEQSRNKRWGKTREYNGEKKSVSEWARTFNLTIYHTKKKLNLI